MIYSTLGIFGTFVLFARMLLTRRRRSAHNRLVPADPTLDTTVSNRPAPKGIITMSNVTPEEKAARAAFFKEYNLAALLTHIGTADWVKMEKNELDKFVSDCQRLVNAARRVSTEFDKALAKAHTAGKLTNVPRFRTRETKSEDKQVDITEMFA